MKKVILLQIIIIIISLNAEEKKDGKFSNLGGYGEMHFNYIHLFDTLNLILLEKYSEIIKMEVVILHASC